MIKSILNFIKIEHTIFSLPLVFTGAWIGAGYAFPDLFQLLLIAVAATGARTFGMAMNRILDLKYDRLNERTKKRELPAGRLSIPAAWAIAASGLTFYFVSCFLLGPFILALSPIPAVVLGGYSLLKRFTWLCHYGIGLAMGLAPIAAFVAVSGGVHYNLPVLLTGAFAFFWISGYDIIYALQDAAFDRKHKVYSIPGKFGAEKARVIAALTHSLAFGSLVVLAVILNPGILLITTLCLCGSVLVLSYMPFIPLDKRFFPLSSIAGILGALIVFFRGL